MSPVGVCSDCRSPIRMIMKNLFRFTYIPLFFRTSTLILFTTHSRLLKYILELF